MCGELVILTEKSAPAQNLRNGRKGLSSAADEVSVYSHRPPVVTLARLTRPAGVRAVAAESLAVKHQLMIMKRSRRRSLILTAWDRVIFISTTASNRRLRRRLPISMAFGCQSRDRAADYAQSSILGP